MSRILEFHADVVIAMTQLFRVFVLVIEEDGDLCVQQFVLDLLRVLTSRKTNTHTQPLQTDVHKVQLLCSC